MTRRRSYPQHRRGVRYPCRCPEPSPSGGVRADTLLPVCRRCRNEYDPRPVAHWRDLDSLLRVARTVLLRDPRHRERYVPGLTSPDGGFTPCILDGDAYVRGAW